MTALAADVSAPNGDRPGPSIADASSLTHPRDRGRTNRWFFAVAGAYAAVVVAWLVLGLLPAVARSIIPVRYWAAMLAMSSSPLSLTAARILDDNHSMGAMVVGIAKLGPTLLAYGFSTVNLVVGLTLAARRSAAFVPRLFALAFIGAAAVLNQPSYVAYHVIGDTSTVKVIRVAICAICGTTYLLAILLYPDGLLFPDRRLPRGPKASQRALACAAFAAAGAIALVSWRGDPIDHPGTLMGSFGLVVSVLGLAARPLRLWRSGPATGGQRHSRLLCAAIFPLFLISLTWLANRLATGWVRDAVPGPVHPLSSPEIVFPAAFAVIPAVLLIGIVRYRLWDIDWLLNRAILYGSLAGAVGLSYILAVSAAGLGTGAGTWAGVFVLSCVAVLLDPVRHLLRQRLNRFFYGQLDSPVDALRALLDGLARPTPGQDLAELTRVVTNATGASRCELWLTSDNHWRRAALFPLEETDALDRRSGSKPRRTLSATVDFHGQAIGFLLVDFAGKGGPGPLETALVEDLAAHAGAVVHNALLDEELARRVGFVARQVKQLRAARRELVATQDAERRQLERNLHDGAQQALVAALISLRTVTVPMLAAGERQAEMVHIRHLLEYVETSLHELVDHEKPSVVGRLGLEHALREAAQLVTRSGTEVRLEASVSLDLPEEAAAAVYFCCLEALQNSTKHARATSVEVTLVEKEGAITFEVRDNGTGFNISTVANGSGLVNLAGRLTPLGGELAVDSAPGHGTTVRGWLPVLPPLLAVQPA